MGCWDNKEWNAKIFMYSISWNISVQILIYWNKLLLLLFNQMRFIWSCFCIQIHNRQIDNTQSTTRFLIIHLTIIIYLYAYLCCAFRWYYPFHQLLNDLLRYNNFVYSRLPLFHWGSKRRTFVSKLLQTLQTLQL